MAKPSKEQSIVLSQLKDEVLEQMKTIGIETNRFEFAQSNSASRTEAQCNATSRRDSISTWCKRIRVENQRCRDDRFTPDVVGPFVA